MTNNAPVWLQNAGYRNSHVGKFINQYGNNDPTEVPPGLERLAHGDRRRPPLLRLQDQRQRRRLGAARSLRRRTNTYAEKDPAGCPDNPPPLEECNYLTDLITKDSISAIDNFAPGPFYLQVDYTTPHGDVALPGGPEPATRDAGTFPGAELPRLPNFNEFDMKDKPRLRALQPAPGLRKDRLHRSPLREAPRGAALGRRGRRPIVNRSTRAGCSPTPTSSSFPTTGSSGRAPLRLGEVPRPTSPPTTCLC